MSRAMSNLTWEKLASGSLLIRNTAWNFLGYCLPLLVGVFSIPPLIQGIGTERFGILTLIWMIIGYFNLVDLGLGRALTKLVSEKLSTGFGQDIPALAWTALVIVGLLGIMGGASIALFSPWLVHSVLNIPNALRSETLTSFYLLAIALPVVICTDSLKGILEAHQRFGLVNAVRIPMGVYMFLGPLVVLPFSNALPSTVAILVVGRVVAFFAYFILCIRVVSCLHVPVQFDPALFRSLFGFGSWMTVSNVISPLMVYIDRFIIASILTVAAVAYYTVPYEVVSKLLIIPGTLVSVLFPAFAATVVRDPSRTANITSQAMNYIFVTLFVLVLIIVSVAREGMDLWLGRDFAERSTLVMQLLAIGTFLNGLAHIPFGVVQAAGRPDLTGKLHLAELPLYLIAIFVMIELKGIEGAAIVWLGRVAVDMVILFAMMTTILPESKSAVYRLVLPLALVLAVFTVASSLSSMAVKGLFLGGSVTLFLVLAWYMILASDQREYLRNSVKAMSMST